MVEVGRTVAGDDFVDQPHLLADLFLESSHVGSLVAFAHLFQVFHGKLMPLHVQD